MNDRLAIEIEFVQCLANPAYLNFLVEQSHFKDPKFVAYLQYLLYLSQPPYTTLFSYPNSVAILRLLCREEFRRQLLEATGPIIDYIHKQQYHHWVNLGNSLTNENVKL